MTNLPKVKTKNKKRVGRGYGSGRGGHTSGRGSKGQKARGKVHILFEGTKIKKSLIRRLPIRRGKAKFKPQEKPLIVNLELLEALPEGTEVGIESLAKAGIVDLGDAKAVGVKILGRGKLTKKLKVKLPTSAAAAARIKKAGGSVEE